MLPISRAHNYLWALSKKYILEIKWQYGRMVQVRGSEKYTYVAAILNGCKAEHL